MSSPLVVSLLTAACLSAARYQLCASGAPSCHNGMCNNTQLHQETHNNNLHQEAYTAQLHQEANNTQLPTMPRPEGSSSSEPPRTSVNAHTADLFQFTSSGPRSSHRPGSGQVTPGPPANQTVKTIPADEELSPMNVSTVPKTVHDSVPETTNNSTVPETTNDSTVPETTNNSSGREVLEEVPQRDEDAAQRNNTQTKVSLPMQTQTKASLPMQTQTKADLATQTQTKAVLATQTQTKAAGDNHTNNRGPQGHNVTSDTSLSRTDISLLEVTEREVAKKHAHGDVHRNAHINMHGSNTHSIARTRSKIRKGSFTSPPSPHTTRPRSFRPPNGASKDPDGSKLQRKGAVSMSSSSSSSSLSYTARTDEAVWAAAALGFLLVLLALSVLHTRLYRQWRTTPSLYWRDPRLDYDSVADVIDRRLRVIDIRRKRRTSRSRRRDFVLLPSSSSEDDSQ